MSQTHIFYSMLVAFTLHTAHASDTQPLYTPDNTQFAFDFHDVVVQHNNSRISRGVLSKNFVSAIRFNRYLPGLFLALASAAYNDLKGGTGEMYIKILQDYQQPEIAQLVLDIANDLQPIEDTVAIIKELKSLGYEINIASDIGTSVLHNLHSKPAYQALLSLFDHEKSVDYINAIGKPIKKPQLAYFASYLQRFQDGKEYVIFIDDKEKNVIGARQAGMIGITFKNPQQLRDVLVRMGILTATSTH